MGRGPTKARSDRGWRIAFVFTQRQRRRLRLQSIGIVSGVRALPLDPFAELEHAVERVAEHPETWPSYIDNTRRFVFRVYPFGLVYRIEDDVIEVVAVAHAKRKPGYWASRAE